MSTEYLLYEQQQCSRCWISLESVWEYFLEEVYFAQICFQNLFCLILPLEFKVLAIQLIPLELNFMLMAVLPDTRKLFDMWLYLSK